MRTISDTGPPVFCALLQPSYELFNLFDRVIIMSQGEIAWQGYREDALPFFNQLGKYRCHENLNPAEFLRMWFSPLVSYLIRLFFYQRRLLRAIP